jgi:CRP/FNR family transcriptional regulator, cyclic AMP receptor protein
MAVSRWLGVGGGHMGRHSQAEIVGILEGIALFANLTRRQLKAAAKVCHSVEYEPGAVMMKELDVGQHLVVITSGTAKVTRGGRTLATVRPGDVIGEMAIIDGDARSATVSADSKVEGIAIYRTAFRKLLDEHPTMCSKLLLAQTARLRALDKKAAIYG